MGKIADLFYKITRGEKAKPWEHGPAKKVLAETCGCGGQCACNSIESLERSAGIAKKVSIKVVPATVDGTAASIPVEIRDHLIAEGHVKPVKSRVVKADPKTSPTPIVKELNKKASAPKKKPVAKATEKKEAIAKDIADTPAPVAKKAPAKKPVAKPTADAKKPAPKKK